MVDFFFFGAHETNEQLVNSLKMRGVVRSPEVENTLKSVDRGDFVDSKILQIGTYADCPQPLGYGATISAPHMHAFALVFYEFAKVNRNF